MHLRIFDFVKREPVACLAGLAALATCALPGRPIAFAAYASGIDVKTLMLLFSLMAVVAGLTDEGVLKRAASFLIARCTTARMLALACTALCFFGSMLVTNDVALIVFVPFALASLRLAGRERDAVAVVVLQTVAANVGSTLSPLGNPQNIYVQSFFDVSIGSFLATTAPLVAAGGVLLVISTMVLVRTDTIESPCRPAGDLPLNPARLMLWAALFASCLGCSFGVLSPLVPFAAVNAAMLSSFRGLYRRIDYGLLATFAFFFVFVVNLQATPWISETLGGFIAASPFAASVATSQIISNVPAAIMVSGFTDQAAAVLAGVNVGGLGTPIASLASLIGWQYFRAVHRGESRRYLLTFLAVNALFLCALIGMWIIANR